MLRMRGKVFYRLGMVFLSLIFLAGCQGPFSQKQEFQSISVTDAKWVDAAIRLNNGRLFVAGGASQLMNARFDYWQPTRRVEIKYDESGDRGVLSLQQVSRTSVGEFSNPGEKNIWNVLLNNLIPIDLNIHVDQGPSMLNLGTLNSRRINLLCGKGDVQLNLSGEREAGLFVSIEDGTGGLEIITPSEIGVRIQLKEDSDNIDMGDFFKQDEYIVNPAYGQNDIFIDMVVSDHSGPIVLKSLSSEAAKEPDRFDR